MKSFTPIIFLIASVALFFLFIDPQFKEVKQFKKEQADLIEKLDKSKELQKKRDALRDRFRAMDQENLDKLGKLLPDTVDNVRLVLDIDNIASAYGMKVKDIAISGGNEEGSKEQKKVTDLQDKSYGTLNLSFRTSAPYDVFMSFLNDLEHALRIVDITTLSVTAGEGNVYDYGISIRTYWLR